MNIELLEKIFNLLDSDGDGILNEEEIGTKATTEKLAFIQSLVEKLEAAKGKQKSLNLKEFVVIVSTKTIEEKLRDAFKVYDLNEDGLITKAELVQAMKLLGEDISEDYAEIVISKVDDDKDGKVNFEEFKNWMREGIKDI